MKGAPFVDERERVIYHTSVSKIKSFLDKDMQLPSLEVAGPREKIFFDPSELKCGIVTCGGLCPGLNDVIRAIVMSLHYHYGVRTIFGFRYGYEGLSSRYKHVPLNLTPENVNNIHQMGGTILGSSRGPQDIADMLDTLVDRDVSILFTIGGDGTLRGSQSIAEEINRRGLQISVIGIPKTIDNDISFVYSAHAEATGARNGIGLVKLMGRESGFIAAFATLAYSEVNFCMVPEVQFTLDAFLKALKVRMELRGHALIVVGEGAGQYLMAENQDRDASGR
jgi:6-phosphofructokinase 1